MEANRIADTALPPERRHRAPDVSDADVECFGGTAACADASALAVYSSSSRGIVPLASSIQHDFQPLQAFSPRFVLVHTHE
jgi:hypothetical protein